MIFTPVEIKDKWGRTVVLRNAQESDADDLIKYLKDTSAETKYLLREPDEIQFTHDQEEYFIKMMTDAEKSLMLVAVMEENLVGTCSLMSVAPTQRSAHRCEIAIALYQKFWGCGIGKKMIEAVLCAAKQVGYEQAELEVISDNESAVALYKELGFVAYGKLPRNMKYKDGSYADAIWMMKEL